METGSMNYASALMIFTPKTHGFQPITFKADTFFSEEEFLGEPQPAKERARQFMSVDGQVAQFIDNFAVNGKRDLTIFDGPESDSLIHWAFSQPQPLFDFAFTYFRDSEDTSQARTHFHRDCKFMNHPAKAMSNDIAVVKFSLAYSGLQQLDAAGAAV